MSYLSGRASSEASARDQREVRHAGRPREQEREELRARRRQEIIEGAYVVVGEKGYKATGTADIAAHLGMGEGTIYRYFESKRDIVDQMVDYGVEQLVAALQAAAPVEAASSLDELADQLRVIAEQVFALLDRQPRLARVVLEATTIDEELTRRTMGLIDTFAAFSATYLAHGISVGFVRKDLDVQVLARALIALLLPGLFSAVLAPVGREERERYIETVVGFARDGLRPPSA